MSQGLACKQCGDYVRGDWGYCEKDGDIFVRTIKERGLASKDVRAERDALRERVQRLLEVLEEVALPPYHDSDLKSLLETLAARAKAAFSIPAGESKRDLKDLTPLDKIQGIWKDKPSGEK